MQLSNLVIPAIFAYHYDSIRQLTLFHLYQMHHATDASDNLCHWYNDDIPPDNLLVFILNLIVHSCPM